MRVDKDSTFPDIIEDDAARFRLTLAVDSTRRDLHELFDGVSSTLRNSTKALDVIHLLFAPTASVQKSLTSRSHFRHIGATVRSYSGVTVDPWTSSNRSTSSYLSNDPLSSERTSSPAPSAAFIPPIPESSCQPKELFQTILSWQKLAPRLHPSS